MAAYFGRDKATLATLLARLSDRVQADDTARREIERLKEIVESSKSDPAISPWRWNFARQDRKTKISLVDHCPIYVDADPDKLFGINPQNPVNYEKFWPI